VISIIVNLFSVGAETNPEAPITTKSKLVAASAEPAVERAGQYQKCDGQASEASGEHWGSGF
jgi:hypothetical protein